MVRTYIKNLKVGKKYSITFRIAGTTDNDSSSPFVPAYPSQVQVRLGFKNEPAGSNGFYMHYFDLTGKEAQWVTETITFQADAKELYFLLSAKTVEGGYGYAPSKKLITITTRYLDH